MKKYPVVALCGSVRYKEEFDRLRRELTLGGRIVITAGLGEDTGEAYWQGLEPGARRAARVMQGDICRRQIDMADNVYLVNPDRTLEEGVWSAACYAWMLGKPVEALVPIDGGLLEETALRRIAQAKALAGQQLLRCLREEDGDPSEYIRFSFEGTAVLDPWVDAASQSGAAGLCPRDDPARCVDPFAYYGKQRAASFVERILTAAD